MRYLRALALSLFAIFPTCGIASAGGTLLVVAGNAPHGVAVRWFGTGFKNGERATISRVTPSGTAVLATVTLHADARTGALGEFSPLAAAVADGDALVDTGVTPGENVRYRLQPEGAGASISGPVRVGPGRMSSTYKILGVRALAVANGIRIAIAQPERAAVVVIERKEGARYRILGATIPLHSGKPAYFSDTSAPIGVTSHYRVHLEDLFGNSSPRSVAFDALARDLRPPARPYLQARAPGKNVLLSWSRSTNGPRIAATEVYRRPFRGAFVKIATLGSMATSYRDAAPPGPSFEYAVRSRSVNGVVSAISNGVFAFVKKTAPPDAPAGLLAKALHGAIALHWDESRDPTTFEYLVFRRDGTGSPVLVATVAKGTHAYRDVLPSASVTSYAYGIGAMDTSGNRAAPLRWVRARVLRASLPVPDPPLDGRYLAGSVRLTLLPLRDPDIRMLTIERADDGAGYHPVGRIRADATTFRDGAVVLGHRYAYAVKNAGGTSRPLVVTLSLAAFVPTAPRAAYIDANDIVVSMPRLPAGTRVDIVRRVGSMFTVVARGFVGLRYRDRVVDARAYRIRYAIVVLGSFDRSRRSAFSAPMRP